MTTHITKDGDTVSLPDRIPHSADELPKDIDGVAVKMFAMPEPVVTTFSRSQLQRMTKEQFAEHAEAIDYAQEHNLIVDDITPPEVFEAMDKSAQESSDKMIKALQLSHAREDVNTSIKALQEAHEHAKNYGDQHEIDAAERRAGEAATAHDAANANLRQLTETNANDQTQG